MMIAEKIIKTIEENKGLPIVYTKYQLYGDYGLVQHCEVREIYKLEDIGTYVYTRDDLERRVGYLIADSDEYDTEGITEKEFADLMEEYIRNKVLSYKAIVLY